MDSWQLLVRRAYFCLWEEKLAGIYMAMLPIVCQTEAMTCASLSPASRVICAQYEFAHMFIHHLQMNAPDLPGRRCLPNQRRSKTVKDVLLFSNDMIKRIGPWTFWFCQSTVNFDAEVRVVMYGSMGAEHYNSTVRALCLTASAASTARGRERTFAAGCVRC